MMNSLPTLPAWLQTASNTFMTTLTGLAFETIPFLLLGTFISSCIHVFVPDSTLRRLFPRNRLLSILVALIAGAFVPICECGTVPLARRLRQKGLPLSTAAAFLVAAPLANPMTILSTYVAFNGGPYPIYLMRLVLGLASAFVVALAVELLTRKKDGATEMLGRDEDGATSAAEEAEETAEQPHVHAEELGRSFWSRLEELFEHTSRDFLDSARFLILGITVASALRSIMPADALGTALGHPVAALGAGAISAYVLSLCSSADAFVARSLFAPASYPAALVFLLLGPMIDLKNSILLSRFVRPSRLLVFILLIVAVCMIMGFAATPLFGGSI
ncbi:MAG TPA: permease [Rectinemataceae bacterium]|nr:permease [Rectinemataceae bacterium]